MAKPLPNMSQSMMQSTEHLFNRQLLIANGQFKVIQELRDKYSRRSITVEAMKDEEYYIVTSPFLQVDIGSTKFNLLIGTVFVKTGKHVFVVSGCMFFEKEIDHNTHFRPMKDMGFIVEEQKGNVATL